jgi:hypothetical protein
MTCPPCAVVLICCGLQTMLIQNLYQNPGNMPVCPDGRPGASLSEAELQAHFDDFFEDVFWELHDKYGEIGTRARVGVCSTHGC